MDIADQILRFFESGAHSWWLYALLVIVPICLLISIREFACWFWKINKIIGRLDRLEARIAPLLDELRPGAAIERRADELRREKPRQGPTQL